MFRRRLWWLSLLVPAILAGSLGAMPEDPAPATKPAPVRDRMCAGCHSGVTIAGSSHGVLSKTIPDGACEACHGSAAAHIEDPWKNPLNKGETAVRGAARCLACHQTGPDHVTAWVKSEFAREGKTCTDCHSVHVESDRHLKHAPDGKGFLGDASCRVCHSPVVTAFAETAHAGVLGQPGGGCEACHGAGKAHVTAIHAGTGETGIAKAPERKACLLCHASVPTTHARRLEGMTEAEAACTKCHQVHAAKVEPVAGADVGAEPTRVGNEACAKCHSATVKLTARSVHAAVSEEKGCETCHGPGSVHVASGGKAEFIVHPGRLTPAAASASCLECHGDAPDHAKNWKGGALEKSGLSCLTCHSAHGPAEGQGRPVVAGEAPAGERRNVGTQVCTICHQSAHPDISKSPHRVLLTDPAAAGCESCHGPGSEHVAAGGKKGTIANPARAGQAALCFKCHGLETKMIRWGRSEHAKAGLTCTSCHDPLSDPKKSGKKRDPDACYVCHQEVRAQFRLPNAHPIRRGALKCASCHDPHADVNGFLALEIRKERCVECHKQYRGPFLFTHEASRQDGCLACHLPHGSTTRRLLAHREVRNLCIQCHVTPVSHDLTRGSVYRNCLNCHGSIHGSYVDKNFLR